MVFVFDAKLGAGIIMPPEYNAEEKTPGVETPGVNAHESMVKFIFDARLTST